MALAAGVAFAVIVAAGSAALADRQSNDATSSAQPQLTSPASQEVAPGGTYQGVVTDSRCGARYLKNSWLNPAECAPLCVLKGSRHTLLVATRIYYHIGRP